MAKNLTAAAVEKLRPDKVRVEIPDGGCPGLFLIIQPSGVKSYALRYRRPDGRNAKLTIGRADVLSLASARQRAASLRLEVSKGGNPGAKQPVESDAFAEAARDFIEHAKLKTRRWQATASMLGFSKDGDIVKNSLADRWRAKQVRDIDEDLIFRIIDEARERGVPGVPVRNPRASEPRARALFSALSSMFKLAPRASAGQDQPYSRIEASLRPNGQGSGLERR